MRVIREALESTILSWPEVTSKEMMGCLVYFRGKKFFAFLVTNGIVVTKLSEAEREGLQRKVVTKPFEMSGRVSTKWVQAPAREAADLEVVLPYVQLSYEAAGV